MAGVGGKNQGSCGREKRGVSPIVGLVLLIGMVIAATALLFLIGSPMLEAFESESEREKVYMCMDESDHRLNTVVGTGTEQSMAFDDPICQPEIDGEGTMKITWYDSSTEKPDWDEESRTVSEDLGTYVFELEDRAIAHQGGGIWELTNDNVRIDKSPNIGFDSDGTFQLDIMRLDSVDNNGSPSRAHNNHEAATNTAERLTEVADSPDGDDLAIKIESKYAEGWERHFEREAEDVDEWDVTVNRPDANVVVVEVEGIGDVPATGHFLIDEDYGLTAHGEGQLINSNLVEQDDEFHIDAGITNYGDEESTVTATLSILDGPEVVEKRTIESKHILDKHESIKTDDQQDWDWIDGNGQHGFKPEDIGLTPGTKYEYDIETDPGGDTLDELGSFYYLAEGAHYTVVDTSTTSSNGLINVSADIRNLGIENGTAEPVTLEIKPDGGSDTVNSTAEVELDSTEAATVSWSINESEWPKGDYEFVVKTTDDENDGSFEIEDGGAFEISKDLGIPEENQLNGTDGQVITAESNVIVEANISNTFATEQTQNITFDVLDGDGQTVGGTETTLTIERSETEQVELTADSLEPGEIYEYNISTENDDLDELGSFLVVDEPAELSIETVSIVDGSVKPGSSLTLEVDVQNQGEDGEQFLWIEGFNGNIIDIKEIDLNSGESTTATLEWGSVAVPDPVGDTTVAVRTNSDERTADVDVDPLLLLNDVTVDDEPIEPGQTMTVEASVESVAGDSSQNVVLEGFDGDQVDSQGVTVSDGETETVSLEYSTDDGTITDRVTVRTDDEDIEEVAVIERDGPHCNEVSYAGSGTSDDPYEVSTVDQLQCIDEHDLDADYELVDDIDAQGTEHWNGGAGFEPIGEQQSWGAEFSGDFDGNGNAIEGLHIDRPNENFVGLFAANSHFHSGNEYGVGDGSKIHNLRLENVSVHGQQVTGGLIGAAGGVIENVRVSGEVTAENQEVGGIIGSSHNADLDNRLVSEATVRGGIPAAATHEVDHPWGANNMGIGGIVGSTGYNTEISTAYSLADVEGPFGVGGIVGWTSDYASENEQMYWAEGSITVTADQDDIDDYLAEMGRSPHDDDTGGAIFGRGDDHGDEFKDSVYYNVDSHEFAFGEHIIGDQLVVNERETDEMQGVEVIENGNLANLDYEEDDGPWVAIPDDYPRFAWELAAEGAFDVTIDDVENVTAGEAATVEATVTSRYEDREESDVEQTIALENPDGQTVDTETVTLSSTLGEDDAKTIELVWQTDAEDNGTAEISVRSEDREDSAAIDIEPAEHGPGASDGPGLGPAPGHGNIGDGSEHDLGPGGSNSSENDIPGVDSNIDINVDVVEIN